MLKETNGIYLRCGFKIVLSHPSPSSPPSVDLVAFPGGAVRMKGFISKETVVLRRWECAARALNFLISNESTSVKDRRGGIFRQPGSKKTE